MLGSVISTKGIDLKISSRLDSPCVSTQHKTDGYSIKTNWLKLSRKKYYKLTKEEHLKKMKTADIQVGQFSYKTYEATQRFEQFSTIKMFKMYLTQGK